MNKLHFLKPRPSSEGLVCHFPMVGQPNSANALKDLVGGYNGALTNGPTPQHPGFDFVSASSMYIDVGTCYNGVKTIAAWYKPDGIAAVDIIADLNGTDYVGVGSGTWQVAGFAGGTQVLYVNGAVADAVAAGKWHHLVVTDTTGRNASDLDIGAERVGATYNDGVIADVRLYGVVLSAQEVKSLYERTRWRYQI